MKEIQERMEMRSLGTFLFLAMFFYWASLPPLGGWSLAFVVPVLWTILIRHPSALKYRYVYAATVVFWLASIWWIACPHPLTALGLIALAAYLSIYWPLFLATSRVAVHQLRIPVIVAAPLCWVGCEFLRNHVLGGFSFCALEHALYLKPKFLQIADIGGGYLVAAMIVAVGTGIGTLWPIQGAQKPTPAQWCAAILGIAAFLASAFYGHIRLAPRNDETAPLRIAAIQGNIPVSLKSLPQHPFEGLLQFTDLTAKAVATKPDLIVWAETVCPIPHFDIPEGDDPQTSFAREIADSWSGTFEIHLLSLLREIDTPTLIGLSTFRFEKNATEPARLNSALLIPRGAEMNGPRYDKVRLVMFGEYIPFSSFLPDDFFLKTLCVEATPGKEPVAIPVGDGYAAVNICFESTIPHWIREQVLTLKRQGTPPGLLINMSNDGWFRFSQQIDQHLATHVFRAIENGLPYVTATNGGFSAIIDKQGRIQKIGTRRAAEAVVGEVKLGHPNTLYHRVGDWPPLVCAIFVILFAMFGAGVPAKLLSCRHLKPE